MEHEKIKLKRLITLREARELLASKCNVHISKPAVIKWLKDLSMQPAGKGGKIYIDRDAFIKRMEGGYNGKDNKQACKDKFSCKADCTKKPEGCGENRTESDR